MKAFSAFHWPLSPLYVSVFKHSLMQTKVLKYFLKLIRKASVPFFFYQGLIKGADRWQVWGRAKGKNFVSYKSVRSLLFNKTMTSLSVTSQCHTNISVWDMLLCCSELFVCISIQGFFWFNSSCRTCKRKWVVFGLRFFSCYVFFLFPIFPLSFQGRKGVKLLQN